MSYSHTHLRSVVLPLLAVILLMPSACHYHNIQSSLAANHLVAPSGEPPTMLAVYLPWFGRPGHIDVGYSSQDRVTIEKQIEGAKRLGMTGFVVNWYGEQHDFEDKAYALMQRVAAEKNFKVAVMYDEDDSDPANATDIVLTDLQYAYDHYAGPHAVARDAYVLYQGRPLIFIFPKSGHTDWNRVHQVVNSWEDPPLLIFKDIPTEYKNAFDGFYAWVNPGNPGWQANGSNWGQQYLENFYKTMASTYPSKIAVGAAWPGFDDSKASWSQNRKMDARCGHTFEDTVNLFRRYDRQHPMPFLMVETWNDYEEGTAIEKGLNPCK